MNRLRSIITLVPLTLFFSVPGFSQSHPVPYISGYSNALVVPNTSMNVYGSGFSATPSENIVFLGGMRASVSSSSVGSITFTVPPGAMYGPVHVETIFHEAVTSDYSFTPVFSGGDLDATSFSSQTLDNGVTIGAFAVGDIDGDGKPDVIVGNYDGVGNFGDWFLRVYPNTSSGSNVSFGSSVSISSLAGISKVYLKDMNGDGKLDVVTVNFKEPSYPLSIFINSSTPGNISFNRADYTGNISGTIKISDLAIGDIDGDGFPDIVAIYNSEYIRIYKNSENGSWSAPYMDQTLGFPTGVVIGDFNGDGKPDIAMSITNSGTDYVRMYQNNSTPGTISLTNVPTLPSGGSQPEHVYRADFDGDGRMDLLVMEGATGSVYFYRKNANAFGFDSPATAGGFNWTYASLGDVDGDGKVDVVLPDPSTGTVKILRNTSSSGSISFGDGPTYSTGSGPNQVITADLNSDGQPEILVQHYVGNVNTLTILKNNLLNYSFSKTSITLSSSTVQSDSLVTATLQLKTNTGAVGTLGSSAIAFGLNGNGTSTGTFGPVGVLGSGTYQSTFRGVTAGTANTIIATIGGQAVTSALPAITVLPGVASPVQSTISVTADSVVKNGTVTVTLQTKDDNGNNLTAGGLPVTFGLAGSGTSNGSFGAVNDLGNGSYTSVFTGTTDGTVRNFVATVNGDTVTSTAPLITVQPNDPFPGNCSIAISASTIQSGSNATITLTTRNINGTLLIAGGHTVAFFLNGSGTSLGTIGSVLDNNNGTYTAILTGTISGTVNAVGGTLDADSLTNLSENTFTVTPGIFSLSASTVTVTPNPVASGTTSVITFQSKDAAGNNVPQTNLTVQLSLQVNGVGEGGTSTGIIGPIVNNNDGSYTATLKGITAGTATQLLVTATGPGIGGTKINGFPMVTVSPGTVSTAQSVVTISQPTLSSGLSAVITLQAKDSVGNPETSGGLTVSFFTTGSGTSGGSIGTVTDNNNGTYTAQFTATTVGTANAISAVVNGNALSSTLPTITVTAGSPTITSITPESDTVDGSVILQGTNFDPTPSNNVVYFGTIRGTVTAASAISLTVIVPSSVVRGFVSVTNLASHLTGTFAHAFQPTFKAGEFIDQTAMSSIMNVSSGSSTSDVATGDLDGDGKPDIIVSNESVGTLTVYRNTGSAGSPSFVLSGTLGAGSSPQDVRLADLDGDGMLDIVITGSQSSYISAFRNTSTIGSISFTTAQTYPLRTDNTGSGVQDGVNSLVLADFNGDGKIDAATVDGENMNAIVFLNSSVAGTISFAPHFDIPIGSFSLGVHGIGSGDLDGDGKPELIVAFDNANKITIYRNTSSAGILSFATGQDFISGQYTYGITVGDVDGDGKADVLTANRSGSVSIFRNTGSLGSISFAARQDVTTAFGSSSIVLSDFDGDGKSDLAVSNENSTTVSLLKNNSTSGSIALAAAVSKSVGFLTPDIVAADFDGDGKPDLALATENANSFSVFRNTVPLFSPQQSLITLSVDSVQSGSSVTVTLRLKEIDGTTLVLGGQTVVFSLSGNGTSTGSFGSVTDHGDGTYSALFTGGIGGTPTSIGATVNTTPLTSTLPTVKVLAGTFSITTSILMATQNPPFVNIIESGNTLTVTLQVKDSLGNASTSGGLDVGFFRTGAGTSTGSFGTTADHGNGTYSGTFTAVVAGTEDSIGVTINGDTLKTPRILYLVQPGTPSASTSVITIVHDTVQSGYVAQGQFFLTVKDANGNQTTTTNDHVQFSLTAGGTSNGTIDQGNGAYAAVWGPGMYYATFTGTTAGTPTPVGATLNGVNIATTSPTVLVVPGPFNNQNSYLDVPSQSLGSGNRMTVTLHARDGSNNAYTFQDLTIDFQVTGGSTGGTFSTPVYVGNGDYKTVFTAGVSGLRYIAVLVNGNGLTSPADQVQIIDRVPAPDPIALSQGNSLSFNGASYVQIPDASDLRLTDNVTLEAWVYPMGSGNMTIIDKGNYNYLFQVWPNGRQDLGFYHPSFGWLYSGGTIPLNQWSHVAVVYQSSSGAKFYLNGSLLGSASASSVLTTGSGYVNIGRQEPNSCQCNLFVGYIDELRVWNVARSVSDIGANYEKSLGAQSGLVAVYHMDDGTGSSLADASGSGHTGTFEGGGVAWAGTSAPLQAVVPTTVTMRWNVNQYADTYELQLSTDTSFAIKVVDTTTTGTSWTVTGLQLHTTYYWRLRGIETPVDTSLYSVVSSFITTTMAPTGPAAAAMNATNLTWSSAQLNGGAAANGDITNVRFLYGTSHGIYTDSVTASPSPLQPTDSVALTAAISNLLPQHTYYSVVAAANSYGYTRSSEASFTTPAVPEPAVAASSIQFRSIGLTSLTVGWTRGDGSQRLVLMRQDSAVSAVPADSITYSSNAAFGSGAQVETGNYVVYDGAGDSVSVTGLTAGKTYYAAVYEYNGTSGVQNYLTSGSATGSHPALFAEPAVQASAVVIDSVTAGVMKAHWTAGNGSSRIVLMKAGSPVDSNPADATLYTANAVFGSGSQLGSGNYVVNAGNDTSVVVTGLLPQTQYYVSVYEYNGSNGGQNYLTASPASGNRSTLYAEPTAQASSVQFRAIGFTSETIGWSNGNGTQRLVVMRQDSAVNATPVDSLTYTPNAEFGSGTQLGTGNYVVYAGTGDSVVVNGLTIGKIYYAAVYEYNGTSGTQNYLISGAATVNHATLFAEPTVQASTVTFDSATAGSLKMRWSAGNGTSRIVLMKAGGPVDSNPVDATLYTASAAFGSGTQLGTGNYVIDAGTDTSVIVTGLQPQTQYYAAVYEYNGSNGGENYLTTSPATGNRSTLYAEPTVQASAINFTNVTPICMNVNWSPGNGSSRIVVMSVGGAVSAVPVNGNSYSADTVFGAGAQIGNGNYIVYAGSGSSVKVTGLYPATSYSVAVFEYNGLGGLENYNMFGATASQTTPVLPSGKYSLTFNGTNNYVTVPAAPDFDVTTGTIDFWFKPKWTAGTLGYNPAVVANRNSSSTRYSIHIRDTLTAVDFYNGTTVASGYYNFLKDIWYHIAVVTSGATTTFYVNGADIGTSAIGYGSTTGLPVQIGSSTGSTEFFNGAIDEVRIWNVARNETQLQSSYAPLTGAQTGLVGYYKLDEGSGTVTSDSSGHGHNGTLVNSPVWSVSGAPLGQPLLARSSSSISFDSIDTGAVKMDSVMITNSGLGVLNIDSIDTGSQYFSVSPTSAAIGTLESKKFYVTYKPMAAGSTAAPLILYSNAQSVRDTVTLSGTATTPPLFSTVASVDFGSVPLGSTQTDSVTVFNAGGRTLSISSVSAQTGDFWASPANLSVNAASVGKLDISFLPPSIGSFSDTLRIAHNASGSPATLIVHGIGAYQAATSAHQAVSFNGSNTEVATNIFNIGGSAITIEYWFKGTNVQSAVRQQGPAGYIVAGWSNPPIHILSNDGGTSAGLPLGNVDDNQWHHVAMTWQQNTTNGFKSYLDGNLIAERTSGNTPIPDGGAGVPLILGSYQGIGEFTNGTLDEVRIWNIARPADSIRYYMNRSLAGNDSGLVAYWRLDDGTGTRLVDATNHGYTGTVYNGTWVSSGARIPGPSMILSATSIAFGTIAANQTKTDTICIRNTGTDTLFITSMVSSPPELAISIMKADSVWKPGDSAKVILTFSPTVSGAVNGTLAITARSYITQNISWTGTANALEPTAQGSGFTYLSGTNAMTIGFTPGSGEGRLILMRAGSPVDTMPANGIAYTANAHFGSGSQIGSDYVVYAGAGDSVLVTGLTKGATYYVAMFEYNGAGTAISYRITSPIVGSNTVRIPDMSRIGTALSFNGKTDGTGTYVDIPGGAGYGFGSQLTVEAWVKWDGTGGFKAIVGRARIDGNPSLGPGIVLGLNNGYPYGNVPVSPWSYQNRSASASSAVPVGVWTHVAFVYNQTNTYLYINGTFVGGSGYSGSSGISNDNAQSLLIGKQYQSVSNDQCFPGQIDEVRIWNVARSQSDIQTYSYAPVSATESGLVGYWQFNEPGGTAVNDSINGVNGTIQNTYARVNSSIPFGPSQTAVQIQSGQQTVNGLTLSLGVPFGTPVDLSVQALVGTSSVIPSFMSGMVGDRYYTISASGTPGNFRSGLQFSFGPTVFDTATEKARLYVRPSATDANTWQFVATADSVNPATGTFVFPDSVTSLGQFLVAAVSTLPPTVQASSDSLSDVRATSMRIKWTNGNGQQRLVLMKRGAPVDGVPGNSITYSGSSTFGTGSQIGNGNYVVYAGTGDSAKVIGLGLDSTYYVCVFEYNGPPGLERYLTVSPATGHATTHPLTLATWAGSALSLNGAGGYVSVNNDPSLQLSTGTLETWVRTANAGAGLRGIVAKAGAYGLFLNNNVLEVYDWGSNTDRPSAVNIADSVWHHIAMTFQSGVTNGTVLYVDGTPMLTTTITVNNQASALCIGCSGDTSQTFAGIVDEVRLWNTVRSPRQLRESKHRTLLGNEDGLVSYWQFEEGSGTVVADSVSSNDGTIMNGVSRVLSTIPIGTGISSSVASFLSGTTSLGNITITTSAPFQDSVAITVTALASTPNTTAGTSGTLVPNRYWIIEDYGMPGIFLVDLTFSVPPGSFSSTDIAVPSNVRLFRRNSSGDSTWTQLALGTNVTDSTVTFSGISSFSQFTVGSTSVPLPVEISSFTAVSNRLNAELKWTTATEVSCAGFEIQRTANSDNHSAVSKSSVDSQKVIASQQWSSVGFINGYGTSSAPHSYSYIDRELKPGKYSYRLKQVDQNGAFQYTNAITLDVGVAPKVFTLSQNYPNPFNPTTTIEFTLETDGRTSLKVYDILGREVATLLDDNLRAGVYQQMVFNASRYSSGVYFAVLRSDGKQLIKKMLLLK